MSDQKTSVTITMGDSNRANLKDRVAGAQNKAQVNMAPIKGRVQISERIIGDESPTTPIFENNGQIYSPEKDVILPNNNRLVRDTNNLIVYRGRSMLLTRAFNKPLIWNDAGNTSAQFLNMHQKFIGWFAVGTKGASTISSQTPNAVNAVDWALGGDGAGHGSISGGGGLKVKTINGREYHVFDTGYPQYLPDSEVTQLIQANMDQVFYDGSVRDSYLVAQIQVTLETNEANGASGTQQINEAGLFMAESDDPTYNFNSYTTNGLHLDMFARVTFPTITKSAQRELVFNWYLYF